MKLAFAFGNTLVGARTMAAPYVGPLGMGAWSKYQKYDSSRQALRGIVEQASRKQAVPRPKKRKPAYSQRE